MLLYEFKDGINTYLQQAGTAVSSLDALIAWNQMHDARVMPYFGQELFERAAKTQGLNDATYRRAREAAKAATDMRVTEASAPPATMTSTSP